MDKEQNKKEVREHVLEAIQSGRVRMRPRWHFALRAALMAVGLLIIFLTLLFLASLALFAMRRTGVIFVPIFGPRGWYAFFVSLPWMLVAAAAIFIIILELLVRHYSFAYKRPLLYSLLGILLIVLIGVALVDQTHVQGRFSRFAEDHHVPFARDFYRQFTPPRFGNIHGGNIVGIVPGGFILQDQDGESLSIIVSPRTRLPLGADFMEGDTVIVFGDRESSTIDAFGIRKVEKDY